MRAVVVNGTGGPGALVSTGRDVPVPGPGEVLLDVAAIGVNYHDVYERSGLYPRPVPFVPGLECAGVVTALGPGVESVAVGDLVVTMEVSAPGAYAQQVVAPAERVVAVPAGVSAEQAAGVFLQGLAVHYLTRDSHPVQAGETALVHAAAGGVGLLLTQVLRLLGARVIGTVSNAAKEEAVRKAGAQEVIRYTEVDFVAEVARLTEGRGVDVVFDGVGVATFDGSVASLRTGGTLALYGQPSGVVPPLDMSPGTRGSIRLIRPTLPDFITTREELVARAQEVFSWVHTDGVTVPIGATYPLAEAATAHADLEERRSIGKLLLIP
ncbi:quinone oxidoreductase family protein [Kitasatospora indigofera]|uniref:quinone oxidoreductase family protein n=1 Tax=Kitasatospora indigofera TaxID=67307 RepID=UPI0036A28ACC